MKYKATKPANAQALKYYLFFALLFLTASLLPACSDSSLPDAADANARSSQDNRLCVSFADYDGPSDLKNLKAALNICQQDVQNNILNGKELSRAAADEEPIPLYSEADREELIQQRDQERAALEYEEEPISEEPDTLDEDTAISAADEDGSDGSSADEADEDGSHEEISEAEAAELDLEDEPEQENCTETVCEDHNETAECEVSENEDEGAEAQAAAALEAEAIPEAKADLITAAGQTENNTGAAPQAVLKVTDESNTEDAAMHGKVYSSEITLDEAKTLRIYFDIDNDLYPIDVNSLCLYDASQSADEAFAYIPLQTAAQNSRAAFKLNWQQRPAYQSRNREAENLKADLHNNSLCARYEDGDCDADTDTDCDTDADADTDSSNSGITLTGFASCPQHLIINYRIDKRSQNKYGEYIYQNNILQTKDLYYTNGDYSYNASDKTVSINSLTNDSSAYRLTLYAINDLTHNITFNAGYDHSFNLDEESDTDCDTDTDVDCDTDTDTDTDMDVDCDTDTDTDTDCDTDANLNSDINYKTSFINTINYSRFTSGYTLTCKVEIAGFTDKDYNEFATYDDHNRDIVNLYTTFHVVNHTSNEKYYEKCIDGNIINVTCQDQFDSIVVTKIDFPDSYWEGELTYWYGNDSSLIVNMDSFIKYNIVDEIFHHGDQTYIGKIIITNIHKQPSYSSISFYNYQSTTNRVDGAIYDKDNHTLTILFNQTESYNYYVRGYLKQIILDNYIYNGCIYYDELNCSVNCISFNDFRESGTSGGSGSYSKALEIQVTDMPFNHERFALQYREGNSSTVKTVNIAAYQSGKLIFGKIHTNAAYVTVDKIEIGTYVYNKAITIDLNENNTTISRQVSFGSFVQNDYWLNDYVLKLTIPQGAYVKVEYTEGASEEIHKIEYKGDPENYNALYDQTLDIHIKSSKNIISIKNVWVNNCHIYTYEAGRGDNIEMTDDSTTRTRDYTYILSDSVRCEHNHIIFGINISGITSKPSSCRLYYSPIFYKLNDNNRREIDYWECAPVINGTYDSTNKTIKFRFNCCTCNLEDENNVKYTEAKINKIVIDGKIYNKPITLNYFKNTRTINYSSLASTKLVVKNVKSAANYIAVTYQLYNSESKEYAKNSKYEIITYKKTAGTYSSADQTYTFTFAPTKLNSEDFDTVVIKSVTLDNAVSTKERTISMGKTYNLLYSNLKPQNTRYSVNVYKGTSGVLGLKGTMDYTVNGKSYTANGSLKHDPTAKRYIMHFETVKTTASAIKVKKVTVGNKYYASSFTMKYGQNKNTSNPNEGRNTRTLNLASGFKTCSIPYTVTLTNAPSLSTAKLKWSTASGSYTTKGKYSGGKITFTMKTSADKLTVGTITAGSKKSIKAFALTPKKLAYSLNYKTQLGKKGNKWVSALCPSCKYAWYTYTNNDWKIDHYECDLCCHNKGSLRVKTVHPDGSISSSYYSCSNGRIPCTAAKMPGGSKCFYCLSEDVGSTSTGKYNGNTEYYYECHGYMKCPACGGTGKCPTCSGKGKRNVLKGVN